jgi:hypothetical protein
MHKTVLGCIAILTVLAACGARQDITLGPAAAVEVKLDLVLLPVFSAYMADLSGLPGRDLPVIDPLKLKQELSRLRGISVVSVEATRDRVGLHFKSADLPGLLAARPDVFAGVLALSRQGAARRLDVTLDRQSVRRFLQFAPAQMRPLLEVLLPPRTGRLSGEEYADYLAWAFEEYSQPKTVLEELRQLRIIIAVGSAGGIVSQTGGRLEAGRAIFELSVIELLSSEAPSRFSVGWN